MHAYYMIFPVTALTIAGYVTLSCALGAQGTMRLLGKILAVWAFLLAVIVAACAIHAAVTGESPMMRMHMYHHHMGGDDGHPMGPPMTPHAMPPGTMSPQGAPGTVPPADMPPPPPDAAAPQQ
jgi:hypothetical protein